MNHSVGANFLAASVELSYQPGDMLAFFKASFASGSVSEFCI